MIRTLSLIPSALALLVPSSLTSVPKQVQLLSNPAAYAGYQGSSAQVIANAGEELPHFEIGYTYVASFAVGSIEGGVFSVSTVTFQKYSFPSLDPRSTPFAFAFASLMPNTSVLYYYESAFSIDLSDGSFDRFTSSSDTCKADYGIMYHEIVNATNTSGPYDLHFDDSASWFGRVSSILFPVFESQASISTAMYDEGYAEGREDGERYGWSIGYNEGLEESNVSQGLIGALFSAVVSVPLNVLNGLTPLAIWNVPIISIIMSFLFLGVVLWIVRKFI